MPKRKTLQDAWAEIASLRTQLGLAPVADDKRSRNLYDSRKVIEALRAQLPKEASAAPAARVDIVDINAVRAKHGKPALRGGNKPLTIATAQRLMAEASQVEAPAAVGKPVASNPPGLMSLQDMQSQLDSTASGLERFKALSAHADSYLKAAAKARAEKDHNAEYQNLKTYQRIENRRAHELFALDPAQRKELERASKLRPL